MSSAPAPTPAEVIAWRGQLRDDRLSEAARFARGVPRAVALVAVVVVGSVARGDFHDDSDIDVLVVARGLPLHPADRLLALGWPSPDAPRVEPIAWTIEEYRDQRRRSDPIAVEAAKAGGVDRRRHRGYRLHAWPSRGDSKHR